MPFRLVLAALVFVPGCAAVIATPSSRAKPAAGIIIPLVKPLLVVEAGKARLVTIPDPDRGYAVNAVRLFSTNKTNIMLNDNGTLKSIVTEQDNTQALQDLAGLAETMGFNLAGNDAGGGKSLTAIPTGSRVEVFEFIPTADGGTTLRRLYPE